MFVQVIEGRVRDADAVDAAMRRWVDDVMPGAVGFLGSTVGLSDQGVLVAMARFESADAAAQNAARPEQDAWWKELEPAFDGAPSFAESSDVQTFFEGGSDEAQFVQFMKGRVDDRQAFVDEEQALLEVLHRKRPEVLGGVRAWFDDGRFVEANYFTNEQEARDGERKFDTDAELQGVMQRWQDVTHDLEFFDVRSPWLTSPSNPS